MSYVVLIHGIHGIYTTYTRYVHSDSIRKLGISNKT
nr:MAG TPA: hypothetical protein [Caudoviricetes sp.]